MDNPKDAALDHANAGGHSNQPLFDTRGPFPSEPILHQRFSPTPLISIFPRPTSTKELQPRSNTTVSIPRVSVQSAMNVSLAPKNTALLSQSRQYETLGSARGANPEVKPSTITPYGSFPGYMPPPSSTIHGTNIAVGNSSAEDDSLIEVASTPSTGAVDTLTPNIGSKEFHNPARQYVLPDGSVAKTGKGLGRGRPGIKRGPRKLRDSVEDVLDGVTTGTTTPTTPVFITPTQSQPVLENKKRKRTESDVSNAQAFSVTSIESRESTPEYNPTASQTRSGRQTQKPIPIVMPISTSASPATKRQASTPVTATPTLKSHPKIKRRVYRGKEQSALCEHCTRGFGPPGNVIVFCDACNKCWHQRCHSPQIPKEVIADSKAEWFCATCDKILHGSKKVKKLSLPAKVEPVQVLPPTPVVQKYGLPLVGAQVLTMEQRMKYLNSLSKERLIEIVVRAGNLAPNMPIFESPIPLPLPPSQQPRPQFASSYVTPVTHPVIVDKLGVNDDQDEGYDDHFDEHAALYPKPGEGVQLPPDHADLHMLLEGPESRTFSHWVRGMPIKTALDTVSLA